MSYDFLTPRRERWYEYYQLYRSYSPYYENRPDWMSSFFVPKTFEAIETSKPRILSAIFDTPPVWSSMPAKPEFQSAGKQWEYYLDTRQRLMNFYMTMYETVSSFLTYDAAFLKVYYQNDDFYEGVIAEPRDIFDIFPDPFARSMNFKQRSRRPRFIVDRDVCHLALLHELQASKLYQNVDKIKKGPVGKSYLSELDRQQLIGYSGSNSLPMENDMHEVLEYWGVWCDTENPDKPEYFDVVATIVDRGTLVRFEECPYVVPVNDGDFWYAIQPYILFRNIALPGELYGIGLPEQIRYLQLELNDRRNQIADAAQLAISPVYEYVVNSLVDEDVVTFAPGSRIPTYMPNALRPLQRDMNWLHGYGDTEHIERDIQKTTGLTDSLQGHPLQRTVKATEHISNVEEANVRQKLPVDLMSQTSLNDLGRMIYLMEHQYTRDDVFAQIMDAGEVAAFVKIDPSKLKFEGDFTIQINSLYGQKGVAAQRRIELAKLALEFFSAQVIPPGSVDFLKILKLIADATDIREKDIIITPSQPAVQPQPDMLGGIPGMENVVPMRKRTMQPTPELERKLAEQVGFAAKTEEPQSFGESSEVRSLAAKLAKQMGM